MPINGWWWAGGCGEAMAGGPTSGSGIGNSGAGDEIVREWFSRCGGTAANADRRERRNPNQACGERECGATNAACGGGPNVANDSSERRSNNRNAYCGGVSRVSGADWASAGGGTGNAAVMPARQCQSQRPAGRAAAAPGVAGRAPPERNIPTAGESRPGPPEEKRKRSVELAKRRGDQPAKAELNSGIMRMRK